MVNYTWTSTHEQIETNWNLNNHILSISKLSQLSIEQGSWTTGKLIKCWLSVLGKTCGEYEVYKTWQWPNGSNMASGHLPDTLA